MIQEKNTPLICCSLCRKPIENYNPVLNQLKLDDSMSAELCQACIDRFLKWQQERMARLFPTRTMKKLFLKKENWKEF